MTVTTKVAALLVALAAPLAVAGPASATLPAPTQAPRPTISGTAAVGQTLTAHRGEWGPSGFTFTWQWRSDGTPITGATSRSLVVRRAQAGHRITVSVTGRRSGYQTTTRTSPMTETVPRLKFTTRPTPTISGSPAVGQVLTADPGSWGVSGTTFTYQWFSSGAAIGGSTRKSYTVAASDIGHTLSVAVTARALGYNSARTTSAATSAVPTPPVTGTAATRTQRMSQSNLNSTQYGWYEQGTVIGLSCYQRGQSVQGYFSSSFPNGGWDNLWYRTTDGAYAADIDLETGTLDPVVPACPDQPVADTTNATVMATTQRMSSSTLNSTQNGTYAAGSRLTLTCYAHGQAVKGYFSSSFPNGYDDLWYKVNDGYWAADVDLQTGSNNPVTPACETPPPPPVSNDLVTRAKSWIDAQVPYSQQGSYTNQYGTYRRDCSGYVSMALGLPSSYTTRTLPQVMHRISKDELQPGDFMMHSTGTSDDHVAIFMGWTDSSHSHYVSWEENGAIGKAVSTVVPYPYWGPPYYYGGADYLPYRRN